MDNADVVIDAVNTLLGFLPEQWKPRVQAVLALLSAGSAFLALWRPFIAHVAPRFAGSAPYVMIDRLLDYVVMNSRRVEVRPKVVKARRSLPPLPCLVLCLVPLLGCAGTAEQHTRTVLDTLALVVEPASQLAFDQCAREKQALADAQKPAEFEAAAERCAKVVDAFDRIATLQDAAATALEAGRAQQAEDMARQVASLWRGMRGGQ